MNAAGLGYIVFDKSSSGVEGKGPIAKFIPSETPRTDNNKPARTSSLTAFALAPGVLKTTTPFSVHASTGILFCLLYTSPSPRD